MTTAQGGQQTLGKILFYRQLEPLSPRSTVRWA